MKKSRKKGRVPLFIIIVPVVLIAFLLLIMFFQNSGGFLKPIPQNTVGNSAGNIRSGGRFCEYDGKVYFANPYDKGALYVMNPDGSEMKHLLNPSVSYLNAGGNYLFYYLNSKDGGTGLGYIRPSTGIYRCTLKGKAATRLDPHLMTMMVLVGDQIYIQHYDNTNFSALHRIPAGGNKEEIELSIGIVETACVVNGIIFYSGVAQDHYLYAWDTKTDTNKVVWNGNTCYPTVVGSYVYFMNMDDNYRLFRYNTADGELIALTEERLESYNIYGNVIFYQTNSSSSPALMRMTLDGSNKEVVAQGVYHRISTTSAYTYFQPFDDENVIYRTSTFGPVSVDDFPQAQEAALKRLKQ